MKGDLEVKGNGALTCVEWNGEEERKGGRERKDCKVRKEGRRGRIGGKWKREVEEFDKDKIGRIHDCVIEGKTRRKRVRRRRRKRKHMNK